MSLVESNKVKVKQGNVVLRVDPDEVKKYFNMGYDVYGADGKIAKRAIPKDVPSLQKAFLDHEAEIAKLKEEIATLKASATVTKAPARRASRKTED